MPEVVVGPIRVGDAPLGLHLRKERRPRQGGHDVELQRIHARALEEAQGILEQTKIYVLSDHGFGCFNNRFNRFRHECSPNTFVVSNDEAMADIFMVDVASFLLSNFP